MLLGCVKNKFQLSPHLPRIKSHTGFFPNLTKHGFFRGLTFFFLTSGAIPLTLAETARLLLQKHLPFFIKKITNSKNLIVFHIFIPNQKFSGPLPIFQSPIFVFL